MNFNQQMSMENEKLRIKNKYLEDFIENLNNFERTNLVIDLKQFVAKNYKRFSMLLDEIYSLKSQLENDQQNKQIEFQRLSQEIIQLKQTIITYQQKNDVRDSQTYYNSLSKEQVDEQIANQSNTIKQLSDEIEELTILNQKLRVQLNKKDFFREYELMCKETEGLRQQNQKLTDQLKIQKGNNSSNNSSNFNNNNFH